MSRLLSSLALYPAAKRYQSTRGIDRESILSCIHPKDLRNKDCIAGKYDVEKLANEAQAVLTAGFSTLHLEEVIVKGHRAQCVRSTPHQVTLRCLNRIIRQTTGLVPSDRDIIVRRLQTIMSEGVPHRVYKYDIRSFFESIDTGSLFQELANVSHIPRSAILVLENYLRELASRNIAGLPRGIQLSATLSEFALKEFDLHLSKLPAVYYHARYVDDIVIVTSCRESSHDFGQTIKDLLPQGLQLNSSKTRVLDIPVQPKSDGTAILGEFDYLGYNFAIHETHRSADRTLTRTIDVAIASKKIKRIKSRICLSLIDFMNSGDLGMLERRLQLLSGNYNVRNFTTGRTRNVGLYCNYRRVNSTARLHELDAYLRSLMVGRQSRMAKRLAAKLPIRVRKSLLRHSFSKNFENKTFLNFTPVELAELASCWRHA